MAGIFGGLGNLISGVGTALNLPDLGIGKALGGNTAPGALQGVNPSTYQGVGINNPNPNTAAILPMTQPQANGGAGTPPPPTPGVQQTGSTPVGASTTPANSIVNAYLSAINPAMNNAINAYNTLYGQNGTGGVYGQGVQNAENLLQEQLVPQLGQISTGAAQNAQNLDWNAIANGLGSSSIAGTQQQLLAQNANNAAGSAISGYNSQLQNLENNMSSTKASDLSTLNGIKQQQAFLNQYAKTMDPSTASYQLGELLSSLNGPNGLNPNLAGRISTDSNGQTLFNNLQAAAPSQILSPNQIQSDLQSVSQSSLPSSLQNMISQAYQNVNTAPTSPGYWAQYTKQLANPLGS